MIGLSLILFYTLLISITEHSSFSFAYFISSLMTIGLISLYSVSILKNKKFPIFIGLSLAALYGFIYVIIQLENYALLVGSIGLFTILAIVMYVSRKVEWESSEKWKVKREKWKVKKWKVKSEKGLPDLSGSPHCVITQFLNKSNITYEKCIFQN